MARWPLADDGFDAARIQRAQMRIVDQRGGPVAAAGIFAMAGRRRWH